MSSASNSAPIPPRLGRRRRTAPSRFRPKLLSDRAGVTSLEWAMVAVAFMLLIISLFDMVRYVVTLQSVTSVMTEAGRACLVNPAAPICGGGSPSSWPAVSTVAPMLDSSQFKVYIFPGPYASGNPFGIASLGVNIIQVTVTYPFVATTPWMSSLDGTISETATYFN